MAHGEVVTDRRTDRRALGLRRARRGGPARHPLADRHTGLPRRSGNGDESRGHRRLYLPGPFLGGRHRPDRRPEGAPGAEPPLGGQDHGDQTHQQHRDAQRQSGHRRAGPTYQGLEGNSLYAYGSHLTLAADKLGDREDATQGPVVLLLHSTARFDGVPDSGRTSKPDLPRQRILADRLRQRAARCPGGPGGRRWTARPASWASSSRT